MIDMVSYGVVYGVLVVCALAWTIMPITWTVGIFVAKVTESDAQGVQVEEYLVGKEADHINLLGGKIRFHESWFILSGLFFLGLSVFCYLPVAANNLTQVGYVQGLSNLAMCIHTFVSKVVLAVLAYVVLIRVSRFVYKLSVRIKALEGNTRRGSGNE